MASRIAMYQREPALFNTDIQNQVNKWESRYIIPLSNAYETAKNQLNEAKAHNLLLSLAVKFAEIPSGEEEAEALFSDLPVEITDEPDIIISETFTP